MKEIKRSESDKLGETERKLELALGFLSQAITERLSAKTWGRITVVAIIEAGFIKEVQLEDSTIIRDLPSRETYGSCVLRKNPVS